MSATELKQALLDVEAALQRGEASAAAEASKRADAARLLLRERGERISQPMLSDLRSIHARCDALAQAKMSRVRSALGSFARGRRAASAYRRRSST